MVNFFEYEVCYTNWHKDKERIERKEKNEKSWELLRECVNYIEENEKKWKVEDEERLTGRQKKERKKEQARAGKEKLQRKQWNTDKANRNLER